MIEIQEEYIKTELNHLKSEEMRSKDEVSNYKEAAIYETKLITKVFALLFIDSQNSKRSHAYR